MVHSTTPCTCSPTSLSTSTPCFSYRHRLHRYQHLAYYTTWVKNPYPSAFQLALTIIISTRRFCAQLVSNSHHRRSSFHLLYFYVADRALVLLCVSNTIVCSLSSDRVLVAWAHLEWSLSDFQLPLSLIYLVVTFSAQVLLFQVYLSLWVVFGTILSHVCSSLVTSRQARCYGFLCLLSLVGVWKVWAVREGFKCLQCPRHRHGRICRLQLSIRVSVWVWVVTKLLFWPIQTRWKA